jgi:hypothetical protein
VSEGDQTLKKDAGKPRVDLLSRIALEGTAEVLGFGARKYAPNGWRRGIEWSRVIGAALRHLLAFNAGEDIDPESGLPHIDHAACCVMFLQEFVRTRKDLDDRFKPPVPAVDSDRCGGDPRCPYAAGGGRCDLNAGHLGPHVYLEDHARARSAIRHPDR